MDFTPQCRRIAIWALISLLIIAFIFGNSLLGKEESGTLSEGITEKLFALVGGFLKIDAELFHRFVRKAAHFTEFAMLGVSFSMIMVNYEAIAKRYHTASVFLATLLVAVSDEFLQNFTGRGSRVSDVLIDFAGGVCGILLTCIAVYLIRRKKEKKQ